MPAAKRIITPPGLDQLPWPLSHAVQVGSQLFISGQVPVDDQLRLIGPDDPLTQARQVWHNIEAILSAAGGALSDLVRIVTYVTDLAHGEQIHAARRERFPDGGYPAATMIEVAAIGIPGALLETEATAVLGCGAGC